jgi:hypothetical protein
MDALPRWNADDVVDLPVSLLEDVEAFVREGRYADRKQFLLACVRNLAEIERQRVPLAPPRLRLPRAGSNVTAAGDAMDPDPALLSPFASRFHPCKDSCRFTYNFLAETGAKELPVASLGSWPSVAS